MFFHEVDFLRKRAGVSSRGQVAVCCYGNKGSILFAEKREEELKAIKENCFRRKAERDMCLNMDRGQI